MIALTLLISMWGSDFASSASAREGILALPPDRQLVDRTADVWDQQPASLASGPTQVVVHINMSPLAMASRNWSHAQRLDYIAQIHAAQNSLTPQIEALGGTILGRFTQLSTGLAVTIDSARVDDLEQLGGVVGVRGIATYATELSSSVPWIGAAALQSSGLTGEGIDVAVIDSGVDYTHAKLGGPGTEAAYREAYCGPNFGGAPDPADPNCNAHLAADTTGYFGDPQYGRDSHPHNRVVGGYDWVGEAWPVSSAVTQPDPNPIDFEGHGTHVADIIGGGESHPSAGDAGVAPGVNLWAFKACSAVATSCSGLALLFALDDAMDLDNSDRGACTPGVDAHCFAYDPADVINLSLGAPYGQPEDDVSLFVNLASYYGSLVVVSAGNDGDHPYIVSQPSTAEAALSVAQTSMPHDLVYFIAVGNERVKGVLQPWSAPIPVNIIGPLQYGDGDGGNTLGCQPFEPWSLEGKVLLVDRGSCAASLKAANGNAAGAVLVVIANNIFSNTPPTFAYGGGEVTSPVLTVTLNDGQWLKTKLGQEAFVSCIEFQTLPDDIVATSARGPRIADGGIKPDIAAPGASVSAEAGTGAEQTAFGGTSGAAPMVAGAAALLIQKFEQRGLLDSNPGLGETRTQSLAPLIKSALMNYTQTDTTIGGDFLAPITLQGAGRVDVLAASLADTVVWDISQYREWQTIGGDPPCAVLPIADLVNFLNFIRPDCADDFPFGNAYFNAWNAQTGSLSFGYEGVAANAMETRRLAILNLGVAERGYHFGSAFRYANDADKGVTLEFSPETLAVPAGFIGVIEVTLRINAKNMRLWTLDAGTFGGSGTNIYCADPDPLHGCPTLQLFEYDGFVTVDGGEHNVAHVPWQVLPRRAAQTQLAKTMSASVKLRNPAKYQPGDTDIFALVEISPNNCEVVNENGECLLTDYEPGILPGINTTAVDLHEVGLRSYSTPGLNAALGLPTPVDGAMPDEVIEFGLTVYDKPFRASHNYPVEFDIYVDADRNGILDYVVFNADVDAARGLPLSGRNAVFVTDLNPADGTRPVTPYFYSLTDFNSQNWILPVPAAAIGADSTRPFNFFVLAYENYFKGDLWDCSPKACGQYHTFQTGLPRVQPQVNTAQVPPLGSYTLRYSRPAGGDVASPSQIGLLFLYRAAEVSKESEALLLP
ncbi:MAG: S8 family serine peptidase [Anaerolineales bacterium]